jgi:hypothetical protein
MFGLRSAAIIVQVHWLERQVRATYERSSATKTGSMVSMPRVTETLLPAGKEVSCLREISLQICCARNEGRMDSPDL